MAKYISEHYGYVPKVTKQTDAFSKTLLRPVGSLFRAAETIVKVSPQHVVLVMEGFLKQL